MTMKFKGRAGMRRWLAAVAAAGAISTVLAGCSASGDTGDDGGDAGAPNGTLSIMVSSADASDAGFRAINSAFEKAYPDVTVKFSTVSNDNYPAALSSRLTANNVDIFVLQHLTVPPDYAKDSASDDVRLARNGGLLDLTDEPFMKKYTPSVLAAQAVDGKQYAVPTGLSYTTGMYYNKDIFDKYGIEVPKTWDELMAASATLEKNGVTPFGMGGKESWPAGLVMLAGVHGLYPTDQAKTDLMDGLWKGSVKLTDQKPSEVLTRTEKVYKLAQKNMAGDSYETVPSEFAKGDFAMLPDGSWNQPVIDAAVDGAFDYGYVPTPMGDSADANAELSGKIELQLAINAGTKNKSAALAWMAFFSQPDNYASFLAKSGFSSAEPGIDQSTFLNSIKPYTKTFVQSWDKIWVPNAKAGQSAVFPFNYPALKPLGSDSAAQAAQAAQKAWSAAF